MWIDITSLMLVVFLAWLGAECSKSICLLDWVSAFYPDMGAPAGFHGSPSEPSLPGFPPPANPPPRSTSSLLHNLCRSHRGWTRPGRPPSSVNPNTFPQKVWPRRSTKKRSKIDIDGIHFILPWEAWAFVLRRIAPRGGGLRPITLQWRSSLPNIATPNEQCIQLATSRMHQQTRYVFRACILGPNRS